MGLHASYYPIPPATLFAFIADIHSENFWREVSRFREETTKNGQEFYVGTSWHVLDFIVNPPDACIPELTYAVRGHEFPAPDGSRRIEPHLASYDDEYWQLYSYVTTLEATTIARYLPLIDKAEFESRFAPEKMKGVYRAPMVRGDDNEKYYELVVGIQNFYKKVAAREMAVLIAVG